MTELLAAACEAALAGGAVLLQRAGDLGTVRSKSSAVDLVTEVDVAAGVAVVRAIADALPGSRFVVEEPEVCGLAGATQGALDDSEVWIVDPLDGTTSYVHGFPCYSVSVAFMRDGELVVGAVYNAAAKELNAAERGRGATRDGRSIAVAEAVSIEEALLITGFPYDRGTTLDHQMSVLAPMLRRVQGLRRDGSAAIDCCHVAAGRADGFWEFALQPWDTAAGALIATEAGAVVTDFAGRPWSPRSSDVLVANPALHGLLLVAIADALEAAGFARPDATAN
jgi:myo-inositol-1(or 4)-monophosphatase